MSNGLELEITSLEPEELESITNRLPKTRGRRQHGVVIIGSKGELQRATDKLESIWRAHMQEEEAIEELMPERMASDDQVLQRLRNAKARQAMLDEFGALKSTDIAILAQSKSRNLSATATRWQKAGRIFGVRRGRQTLFPGFQFSDDGQPLSVVRQVLGFLSDKRTAWEIAIWFISGNGWLDGKRPVDLLRAHPDTVVAAAEKEVKGVVF